MKNPTHSNLLDTKREKFKLNPEIGIAEVLKIPTFVFYDMTDREYLAIIAQYYSIFGLVSLDLVGGDDVS